MAKHDLRTLTDSRTFVESARWHDGRVYFCDWATKEVIAVDRSGHSEALLRIPTKTNGATPIERGPFSIEWSSSGNLLIVSGQDGLVLEQDGEGLKTYVDLRALSPYAWNEIALSEQGYVFVNNAAFGAPEGRPNGIVAVISPDGTARTVAEGLSFPNGMLVKDETLIVAESGGKRLTAFDIAGDGALIQRRVWAEVDGHPDGICRGAEGIWYADVPNRACVCVAEGGKVVDRIDLDRGCFSCAMSDSKSELFIAAAQWRGFDDDFSGPPTGRIVAATL